jgi:hypothetical protein
MKKQIFSFFVVTAFFLNCFPVAFAQSEILTNSQVIALSKAGLSGEVILNKIEKSRVDFDISTNALIELKKSGVADEIIAAMLNKAEANKTYSTSANAAIPATPATSSNSLRSTDSILLNILSEVKPATQVQPSGKILSPKEALATAKTIAFQKSSFASGSGKGIASAQRFSGFESDHRALQGKLGFIRRNRLRFALMADASLCLPHLRPSKRSGFGGWRDDFMGKPCRKSGATYHKKLK